jgi:uncharacterized membrane protein YbjE (DUF340 family)
VSYLLDAGFYLALALGLVAGRLHPFPKTWGSPLIQVTILLLVATLGFQLGTQRLLEAPLLVGESALFALLLVLVTSVFSLLLGGRARRSPAPRSRRLEQLRLPLLILGALLVGYFLGVVFSSVPLAGPTAVEDADLLLLLFLVGWDIRLTRAALRRAAVPLASAGLGVAVLIPFVALVSGTPWNVSAAVLCAFGWYTLAGPVVASGAGASIGLLAFLTNFLRENFTMLGSQAIGGFSGPEGIAACGGATAMDTTLFFVADYGGPEAGGAALTSGAILTLAAPFLLTLLLLL